MSKTDSLIPAEWFERAEKDYVAARHLLEQPEAAFTIPAAMLLQQAVEKYLKGFLLAHDWTLKRTHDLADLLQDALSHAPELAAFGAACVKITEYYTEQRYPPVAGSELTREEVLQSLAEAKPLVEELKRLAPPAN